MAMCKGFEHGGDPLEFFKGDTSAGAFGGCNDGLADHVVLMAAEASLPSLLTLEGLLGPFGPLAPLPTPLLRLSCPMGSTKI